MNSKIIFWLFLSWAFPQSLSAQQAHITEEETSLVTYPYSDPNPVPVFTKSRKAKIYPYHLFEGYSTKSIEKKWKVVKLENDYIEVYVLPEIGGKVWGAIEKSTGNEFIYKNEVVKFRDISLRGPWTSGGIEFNFGIIGHTPSTAAPVDYETRENADGSVSCFVGNMDLTSRTHWTVEIRLPKDKAYFETKAMWYNPTPTIQSYYNWMTAAARASDDLEFFYPGTTLLEHNGKADPWPIDKNGIDASHYANNNFGGSKSYHVTGATDFMGGYYHNTELGFGHWALLDEMPGRKLFLWSLARSGGIWEDLLTDTDGQYIEFQAGRLFNQYSPGSFNGPIRQVAFPSGATDTWTDIWFPVKGIGGMKEVSKKGVLNVEEQDGALEIGINALAFAEVELTVLSDGKVIFSSQQSLKPMDVYTAEVPWDGQSAYEVIVDGMGLDFKSTNRNELKRPFTTKSTPKSTTSASWVYYEGKDFMAGRDNIKAKERFKRALQLDSFYIDAMVDLASIYYESAQYDSALVYVNKALRFDTYHPGANYQAGNVYRAKKDYINALESFGWAGRSLEFRSSAYAQMAAIALAMGNHELVGDYAKTALDYGQMNINALEVMAINYRKLGNIEMAERTLHTLKDISPLSHFADYESYLLHPSTERYDEFASAMKNEFPYQTFLELSLAYLNRGDTAQAIALLKKAPVHPLVTLWNAYLTKDQSLLSSALEASADFVFPYRRESIAALEWAVSVNKNWKSNYYLALDYWAVGREVEAKALLKDVGQQSKYAPFYSTRASLLDGDEQQALSDLEKAYQLAPQDWRTASQLIGFYDRVQNHEKALEVAAKSYKLFPGNFSIALLYAKQLMEDGRYEASIELMKKTTVLPFEGSGQGKVLYRQALLLQAIELMNHKKFQQALTAIEKSREWPENLGVGKPFSSEIDERLEDWLAYKNYTALGEKSESIRMLDSILSYTQNKKGSRYSPNTLISAWALQQSGKAKEGEALISEWEKSEPKNAIAQWAKDVYRGKSANLPVELDNSERFRVWKKLFASRE